MWFDWWPLWFLGFLRWVSICLRILSAYTVILEGWWYNNYHLLMSLFKDYSTVPRRGLVSYFSVAYFFFLTLMFSNLYVDVMLVKVLSVIHSLWGFFSLYHWPGAVSHCLTWAHFLLHINSISELCAFVWFVITKAALASLSISQSKRCTIAPFPVKAFSAYWLSRIWNYNLTNPDFSSMQIYPKWRKWRKKLS